jgi:hypothetical protein
MYVRRAVLGDDSVSIHVSPKGSYLKHTITLFRDIAVGIKMGYTLSDGAILIEVNFSFYGSVEYISNAFTSIVR